MLCFVALLSFLVVTFCYPTPRKRGALARRTALSNALHVSVGIKIPKAEKRGLIERPGGSYLRGKASLSVLSPFLVRFLCSFVKSTFFIGVLCVSCPFF